MIRNVGDFDSKTVRQNGRSVTREALAVTRKDHALH